MTFFRPSSGYQPLKAPQWLISVILATFQSLFKQRAINYRQSKTIFVVPYPKAFMGENIGSRKFFVRLWLLSQLGHI